MNSCGTWSTSFKIVLLTICSSLLYAEAPDTLWTETYGGTAEDYGWAVVQANNGYIIAGYAASYGAGGDDIYVIKINEDGDTLWTKTYGGVANERAFAAQRTNDAHYIITGFTSSIGSGGSDVWLLKIDENGDTVWSKNYGGITWDTGYWIEQTSDSGYIITGFSTIPGLGDELYLIKTDANGDTLWTKTYGGTNQDYGKYVKQTSDGGYIVVGYTYSLGLGGSDIWLLKTDANGDTLWTKLFGGNLDDRGSAVFQNNDKGYTVIGSTESFVADYADVYLIRTDSLGESIFTKTYGGDGYEDAYAAIKTQYGFVIAGYTYSYGMGESDVYLFRINDNGDTVWTKSVGGLYHEAAYGLAQTTEHGYVVTGRTRSFGAGQNDVYVIKLAPDNGIDECMSNAYTAHLVQIAPNPFYERAVITWQPHGTSENVAVDVFDVSGRLVTHTALASGTEQFVWNGCDSQGVRQPSGVYVLQLCIGDWVESAKLLLLN